MKLRDILKTMGAVWDAVDAVVFLALALFVLAALGYAGFKYLAG